MGASMLWWLPCSRIARPLRRPMGNRSQAVPAPAPGRPDARAKRMTGSPLPGKAAKVTHKFREQACGYLYAESFKSLFFLMIPVLLKNCQACLSTHSSSAPSTRIAPGSCTGSPQARFTLPLASCEAADRTRRVSSRIARAAIQSDHSVCVRKWAPRICCAQPSARPGSSPAAKTCSPRIGLAGSQKAQADASHKALEAWPAGRQRPAETPAGKASKIRR